MVYYGLPIMVNQFGWWVRWGGRVGVNPYGQPDHEIPPFFTPSLINLSELLKRSRYMSREKDPNFETLEDYTHYFKVQSYVQLEC